VIAVHLYGHPADMDALTLLTEEKGIHLIEDSAQGIGARWRDRSVGSFGVFSTFSLYGTKNVTTGEGGMITTSDSRIDEIARALRSHESRTVVTLQVASNSRMTDLEAAIGRVQLGRLDEFQTRRHQIAAAYDNGLDGSLTTPHVAPEALHGYHQYTIRAPRRADLIEHLRRHGIGAGVYYPVPVHLTETYRHPAVRLPDTETAAAEVLSLPIRPDLTAAELTSIIETVNGGMGA
jgi:dTDP-4-amino-4,6-dideoxygalactose transaminase